MKINDKPQFLISDTHQYLSPFVQLIRIQNLGNEYSDSKFVTNHKWWGPLKWKKNGTEVTASLS